MRIKDAVLNVANADMAGTPRVESSVEVVFVPESFQTIGSVCEGPLPRVVQSEVLLDDVRFDTFWACRCGKKLAEVPMTEVPLWCARCGKGMSEGDAKWSSLAILRVHDAGCGMAGGSEGFEMQEMELVRVTAFEPWSDRVRTLSVRNDLRSSPVQIQVRATLSDFGEAQLQLEADRSC